MALYLVCEVFGHERSLAPVLVPKPFERPSAELSRRLGGHSLRMSSPFHHGDLVDDRMNVYEPNVVTERLWHPAPMAGEFIEETGGAGACRQSRCQMPTYLAR